MFSQTVQPPNTSRFIIYNSSHVSTLALPNYDLQSWPKSDEGGISRFSSLKQASCIVTVLGRHKRDRSKPKKISLGRIWSSRFLQEVIQCVKSHFLVGGMLKVQLGLITLFHSGTHTPSRVGTCALPGARHTKCMRLLLSLTPFLLLALLVSPKSPLYEGTPSPPSKRAAGIHATL